MLSGITLETLTIAGICQIHNNERDTQEEPNANKYQIVSPILKSSFL